jgi:hypothetical protein
MKERPITFSAPMVRAILDGRKTVTRRLVRPQPEDRCPLVTDWGNVFRNYAPHDAALGNVKMADGSWGRVQCHYGQPGDLLWVRETWYCDDYRVQRGPYLKPEDFDVDDARCNGVLVYKADGDRPYEAEQPVWRPSIFMPRWASRITLEITDVRLERLQDISEADAVAEGCKPIRPELVQDGLIVRQGRSAVEEFRLVWEEIHGPGSWDANPWVWVIEFKRLESGDVR